MRFLSFDRSGCAITIALGAAMLPSGLAFGQLAITNLGNLGGHSSYGLGVSADGSVVTGYSSDHNDSQLPFRWTNAGGMQNLGFVPGYFASIGQAVSGDGSVIAGYGQFPNFGSTSRAARWTAGGGWQNLGAAPGFSYSMGYAISGDGSVVVGRSYQNDNPTQTPTHASRWTSASGMQDLGTLGGVNSSAAGISANGQVVTGYSDLDATHSHAFRWTSGGGMQDLGTLLGDSTSTGSDASLDGSVIVGSSGTRAFRWTSAGGMQSLGSLSAGSSNGYGVSGDGSVVVGGSAISTGDLHAFVWTPTLNMVDLNTYLPAMGVDLTGWTLSRAFDVSLDGTAITGVGVYQGLENRAFLITGFTGVPAPGGAAVLALGGLFVARRRRAQG
jgi:probable HAF family extracellular repeat protein